MKNEFNGNLTIQKAFASIPTWHINKDTGGVVASVYNEQFAKLFAAAPELLAFVIEMKSRYLNSPWIAEEATRLINNATE